MVVYQIIGDEIGINGCGAAYFATQKEAILALYEYQQENGTQTSSGPYPIKVNNRRDLAFELNEAMGYGAT